MPSSSGVSSRTALLFLRPPDLGCHVCRQIRINASYWLRTIRACACGCYFRPTICTYSTSSSATASTTLMLPRGQAKYYTIRAGHISPGILSTKHSLVKVPSQQGSIGRPREKKMRKKKKREGQNKWVRNGVAGLRSRFVQISRQGSPPACKSAQCIRAHDTDILVHGNPIVSGCHESMPT